MRHLQEWAKLPSAWIERGGLKEFQWGQGVGANNIAALMALAVTAHHADAITGVANLTYSEVCDMVGLSRAKLSSGLDVLEARKLVVRGVGGRSSTALADYDPSKGWVQFPAKGLYREGIIPSFHEFRLRLPAELEALKLYFLFASRRERSSNLARISYEKIESYSGVSRNNIKRALGILAAHGLVYTEHLRSDTSIYGVSNAYRLAHLATRLHMGTTGRAMDLLDG